MIRKGMSVEESYNGGFNIIINNRQIREHQLKKEVIEVYFKTKIIKEILKLKEEIFKELKLSEVNRVLNILIEDFKEIIIHASAQRGYNKKIPCVTVDKKVKYIEINITLEELAKSQSFKRVIKGQLELTDLYEMKERFKVVFISPFSYGKSTLINALIGCELLNSDVRAETANITKLIYGPKTNVLVKKEKGVTKEVAYKEIEELPDKIRELTSVQEQGNEIYEVVIEGEIGFDTDITFIDSPGLFSRYTHHNDLSKRALQQGNLIIFLIDPAHVGDSNFSEFIRYYRDVLIQEKKDICFVISKRDLYDRDEENRILNETKIVLEELGLGGEDIYFVSSYMGLKSFLVMQGKQELETLRKDRNIFVEEDGEILKGRSISEKHLKRIWEYSQIELLKQRILQSKVLYGREKKCLIY